jgi:hypothetical protein
MNAANQGCACMQRKRDWPSPAQRQRSHMHAGEAGATAAQPHAHSSCGEASRGPLRALSVRPVATAPLASRGAELL